MGSEIRFLLNGVPRRLGAIEPTTTVLDYLREVEHACGTKEGCAEGDCGACTVAVGEIVDGHMRYRAIDSCIAFLPQLDGKALVTVEGLRRGDQLHPVQEAMVACDASQCGFCTPGFVMALFAFQHGGEAATPDAMHEALAGNLCRCTGYRPIVAAARQVASVADWVDAEERSLIAAVGALGRDDDLEIAGAAPRYFAPRSMARLLALRATHPQAHLLAGGTDLALLVTKEYRQLDTVISVASVPELAAIEVAGDTLTIGAAATYTDALPVLERYWPSLGRLIRRIGSRQIRHAGTIGGNIANASPIGDMPPALIALDAVLELRSERGRRTMELGDFFRDYRRTALQEDEIVAAVRVKLPEPNQLFATYKIAKRWDQDISAVCGAFRLTVAGGVVAAARVAYGGMAATPRRAVACERALTGRPWTGATVERAAAALAGDFNPIGDWRASAEYRAEVAANLLRRFWLETSRSDQPCDVMAL